jgi:DNA helicase II / ATP-dependent DNA helicase PcrA
MEPSRFLADLPPELFGLARAGSVPGPRPAARGPTVRRHPGALPGDPHIELEEADPTSFTSGERPERARPAAGPTVDYDFDQRPESGRPFARGEPVWHEALGEGMVLACDGVGRDAKVTVRFDEAGEKRVLARFLRRGG